jgi:hypothetical protein
MEQENELDGFGIFKKKKLKKFIREEYSLDREI